jgi:selenide,water dikinase
LIPAANPNVLRSIERLDDAGVYKISDELAIIQTIDFITPIVNDPYSFGQIAAANSISDIYTMGGKPITAMNVVCFPSNSMDISVLREILRGGLEKMEEAGVALMGGHSVTDPEMKYGLSVTGIVHPDKLGTGVLSTALKNRLVDDKTFAPVVRSMTGLNKIAAEIMIDFGVHACTDITGFGLVGHASHLIQEGDIGIELDFKAIPVFSGVSDLLKNKVYPGGLSRNRDFYSPSVEVMGKIPEYGLDILFDPQTSGGLLIALAPDASQKMVEQLHKLGINAAIIGKVTAQPEHKLIVR